MVRMQAALGPMKVRPACSTALGEVGVLGQEAVAGMDRLGAADLGGEQDSRLVEIAPAAGAGPMQSAWSAWRTWGASRSASE